MGLTIEIDRASAAIDLIRRWQAHTNDACASQNTLFAVYGVKSPLGRFADSFAFNNPSYTAWLEDVAYDHGASTERIYREDQPRATALPSGPKAFGTPDAPARITPLDVLRRETERLARPRTASAQRMIDAGLTRHGGRRVPMTPAALAALLDYYREKLALLREIEPLSDRGRREHREIRQLHRRAITRHIRAVSTALREIAEATT
jgi:hypothetical protein